MLTLTAADFANLSLLESPALAELLEHAQIVPWEAIGTQVVTMYSRVLCVDALSGERRVLRLIYPADKPAGSGDISVLSPAGLALLGAEPGKEIEWHKARLRVEAVLYQPERDLRANLISA